MSPKKIFKGEVSLFLGGIVLFKVSLWLTG